METPPSCGSGQAAGVEKGGGSRSSLAGDHSECTGGHETNFPRNARASVLFHVARGAMSLRIYFAGSIRGGREDAQLYHRIIGLLQRYGTVLTEHVGDPSLVESGWAASR